MSGNMDDIDNISAGHTAGVGDFTFTVGPVAGDDNSISLRVVGELFEGLSKVKRQQKVYGFLKDLISTGEIHAVNMQTLTPAEANK